MIPYQYPYLKNTIVMENVDVNVLNTPPAGLSQLLSTIYLQGGKSSVRLRLLILINSIKYN